MITIKKPLSFTEIGKKDNQEDYLYPANADTHTRIFIMCDGMGGHDNGEVASMTAANALGDYLMSCTEIDIPTFETGLAKAYDALDNIDTNSAKKPGTTMTCLCLNEDNYLVAHIGDSRIYHIRPSLFNPETKRGGILYQSSDHSLVNDLLKAGELTEDEARDFPQKNVITRAMQPHLPKRYKADVYMFDDIQGGDYFFLCCDGVLEQLSNDILCGILADKNLDDAKKLAKIKSICDGNTRDNYTCWLVPIDKVKINNNAGITPVIQADAEMIHTGCEPLNHCKESNPKAHRESRSFKIPIPLFPRLRKIQYNFIKKVVIRAILTIALIVVAAFVVNYVNKEKHKEKNEHVIKTSMKQGQSHSKIRSH